MKKVFFPIIMTALLIPAVAQNGGWQEFSVGPSRSLWASSSLSETIGGRSVTYGPEALFDGDTGSPWVEGVPGSGVGESLTVMTQRLVSRISVVNGFARSRRLFERNNRVREVSVSFVAGMTAPGLVTELDYSLYFLKEKALPGTFELRDSMEEQSLALYRLEDLQKDFYLETLEQFSTDYPDLFSMALDELGVPSNDWRDPLNLGLIREIYGFYGVRIRIQDVYRGSHYDDTCVSELEFGVEEF
ncbi:hypothetical protein B4O97_18290 [Marispirochaeta aestuarii]|uniref:NAD glycohydrolase translocation F5/8 type C domain-containing protein n=1 Tax=Marispirochaeta aestuarii TaxID=1963862 RepID=A0A1Y1RT41_9SPIO|nr:hypothetical protein [Marispirochaeta aestuarii]ORC30275.1 hypothetical protein B4O97_18290 [Marispirochaeta aestuarii]